MLFISSWNYIDDNGDVQNYLGVDYNPMLFMMVNAIKEQQLEINQLKRQLQSQQSEIDDIKAILSSMN